MSGVVLILGLAVFIFVLIGLSFRFNQSENQKHEALQLLFFGIIMASLMLVGKATVDYNDYCDFVVVNETTVNSSLTTYEYNYQCGENDNETSKSLLDLSLWLFRLTLAYIVVYVFYHFFNYIYKRMTGRDVE